MTVAPMIETEPHARREALARGPDARPVEDGAGRCGRSGEAAQHARRPALELDLCARRDRFDDMTDVVQGAAPRARASSTRSAGPRSSPSRSRSTARANGCCGCRRGHEAGAPEIETVYIPESDRGTLCISSQVGCTLTCSFCHTGTQRLVRNLDAGGDRRPDHAGARPHRRLAGRRRAGRPRGCCPTGERKITNVVLMGMGEPLYNFDNVRDAMAVAADGEGLAISQAAHHAVDLAASCRRSRAGARKPAPCSPSRCTPCATSCATSWCRSTGSSRSPICWTRAATIPGLSNARRITFEYVMLKGVNDSLADAKALVRLLAGIPAKINLIPFNPWPGRATNARTGSRSRNSPRS